MQRPSLKTLYKPAQNNQISSTVFSTNIDGLYFLPHSKFEDKRGFFSELARLPELEKVIEEPFNIRQVNLAHSKKNVLRGFHAENWSKLVNVVTGECFCVVADTRSNSKTFGKVESFLLGETDKCLQGALFLPAGVANSVCILEGPVNYVYCVDALYKERDPKGDIAISLFDPDINVDWPLPKKEMVYSERDTQSQTLREKFPDKFK